MVSVVGMSAPQKSPIADDTCNRIVTPRRDVPIVHEKAVGEAAEAHDGFVVCADQRFLGHVGGGHHEGPLELAQQQMVQRGVREHQSNSRIARCHVGREPVTGPLPDQHDGPLNRRQQAAFDVGQLGQRRGVLERSHHHREWLLVPALSMAQQRDRCLAGGVAGQMKAAEPLDGDNEALA